jgi:hypothetical protein
LGLSRQSVQPKGKHGKTKAGKAGAGQLHDRSSFHRFV